MTTPAAVTPGDDLRAALAALLDGLPPARAAQAVERLITAYRGDGARTATTPVLRDREDTAAYAAYRMPATYAAVRAALGELRARVPGLAPAAHTDAGGGTGAAVWAVADAWPGHGPGSTVLDWSAAALALGRELAASAASPAVRAARWERARLGAGAPALPAADLVTVSYVIGELRDADRDALIDAAAAAARAAVLVVEPGTPDGTARVLAARDRLLAAGFTVAAPCPHTAACPLAAPDWCHFAARVPRTSLHRRLKGGSLPYEDEKFAYVAAVRPALLDGAPPAPAPSRVVRHPQIRKGQVLLDLCRPDATSARTTVTKRSGAAYRAARDVTWGGTWES
jgi:ribosomal protein RSM22 (predicted rRNA methylase)